MTIFHDVTPTLDSRWRAIVLFGRNVASYKFALASSLLQVKPGTSEVLRLYGYAKAVAAIEALKAGQTDLAFDAALERVQALIKSAHNPVAWAFDVAKKAAHLRLTAP